MPQKRKILSLDTKYKMQRQCFNQMDQEISIQLKHTTKKNFIVEKIRAVDSDCEFQVNLKMSINWLSKAWDKVTQTYIKVFHKSIYNTSHKVSLKIRLRFIVITSHSDEEIPIAELVPLSRKMSKIFFDEFEKSDNNVKTTEEITDQDHCK